MSAGEEKTAFQKQKDLRDVQKQQQKANNATERQNQKVLIEKSEAELLLTEEKQKASEEAFRVANPNQTYAQDLAKSQLKEPYDEKLNAFTYNEILLRTIDTSKTKRKSNSDYSLEKIFDRRDSNSDGEIYLWYPHVFEKNTQDETDPTIKHLSQLTELEKYGAYHFQIYYYPTFKQSLSNVLNHAIKDLTTELSMENMSRSGDEIYKTLSNQLSVLGEAASGILSDLKQTYERGGSGVNLIESLLKSVSSAFNNLVDITPQSVFDGHSGLIANIYLPLNKLDIRRESGVTSKSNVITNVGTSLLKQGLDLMVTSDNANSAKGWQAVRKSYNDARGRMVSEFKAPRLKNPELDIREFSWDLIPRTSEEHRHIMHILSFFASLSVPTFERNDMLFYMPPILKMKALSSKINDDLEFQGYDLIPEKQYYLIEYGVNFNYSEDSVMLDENGMPMGATLTIRLIKNELVNGRELFSNPLI